MGRCIHLQLFDRCLCLGDGIDETVAFMKNFVERKMDKRPPHFG